MRSFLAGALPYQLGRFLSYGVLGAIAGGAGAWALSKLPQHWTTLLASTVVSWTLAACLLFAAHRLLKGSSSRSLIGLSKRACRSLERNQIVPVKMLGSKPGGAEGRLSSLARALFRRPWLLGLMTGLLPCGALYAALLLAAGTGSSARGATVMVAFSAISSFGPLMAGATVFALPRFQFKPVRFPLRLLTASVLLVGALVLLVRPIQAVQAANFDGTAESPETTHHGCH